MLVYLGAEIYMRDCRGRTARETATRRQHLSLLRWLDTQVQIRRIQEQQRRHRMMLLQRLREAQLDGKLRLAPDEQRVDALVRTMRRNMGLKCGSCSSSSASRVPAGACDYAPAAEKIASLLRPLKSGVKDETPAPLRPRQPGYADWQWPLLLARY